VQVEIHWYGWFAMFFYLCALGFYLWVRITKTMNMGPGYVWYGIYLLVVEILGASTVILYGTNLLWNPVIEEFPEDPESPGKPKVGQSSRNVMLDNVWLSTTSVL
jgi:endoglucanase